MAGLDESLHSAAVNLEETLRLIDVGELESTSEQRALIVGCIKAWKLPPAKVDSSVPVSGGFPVDPLPESSVDGGKAFSDPVVAGDEPANAGIAGGENLDFDGGDPFARFMDDDHMIDGGTV